MGIAGGPNLNQDGLVFLYDVFDQDNSYKGEPTTNVVSNTNLDDGWAKGYHYDIIIGDTYPKPKGITSQAVSFRTANTYGYWYSYGNYAPQDDNTTYSISIWARTVGNSFYIQPYTADNSEAHRFWMSSQEVIGNGEWQRLTWPNAYTTPSSNDSDSLSFHFPSIPVGQRCWLLAPQLEPKSHVTPFIEGTRSATQGLLDVAGTNQINISNVSFDANAQITFDGTNDYINIGVGTGINQFSGDFTISLWAKRTAGGNYGNLIGDYYTNSTGTTGEWQIMMGPSSELNLYKVGPGYIISNIASGFSNNTWINVVATRLGSLVTMYANSNVIATGSDSTSYGTVTGNLNIGIDGNNSSEPFPGNINSISIYKNRALSAQEVLQNYNATKSRFNLK